MQLVKYIVFLMLICFNFKSYAQEADCNKDALSLLITIINSKSLPLPPPPLFKGDSIVNTPISEHIIDSLMGVSLNIGVYPRMESDKLDTEHLKISKDFAKTLEALWKVEEQSMEFTTEIDSRSKHQVVLADSLILKASADWKEYDLVYNFSPLFFNASCTEAVLSIGISRSKFWGYGGYYWYKKDDNDNWYCKANSITEKW